MRVRLSEKNLSKLFKYASSKGFIYNIASSLQKNERTIRDWKRGTMTMPLDAFKILLKISNIKEKELSPEFLPDFWHTKYAGKKGGIATNDLYGNFGTKKGRRRGGLNSIKKHRMVNGNFKTLKIIRKPKYSKKLAELLGILFGDGHLSEYQVSVTTNSLTDKYHALFSRKLIEELFNIDAKIKNKKNENTIEVIVSSKNLVNFLNNCGMPIGNKIKNKLIIPKWIKRNNIHKKYFLRGVFDTDGCIYLDKHRGKKKIYKYLGWTVTTYSNELMSDLLDIINSLGFSPTHRNSQNSVYLRRQTEIRRYFDYIGTSNPKHLRRYKEFIGGVPKWS